MIYLIGNKSDMPGRQVVFERAVEFAQKNNIHKCFETSAMTGDAVE
jgi:hypothetical protein